MSGFPYGVIANANELINRRDASLVGISLDPSGYHDILLRKTA